MEEPAYGVMGMVIGGVFAWHLAIWPTNELLTTCEESLPRSSYCELVAVPIKELATD